MQSLTATIVLLCMGVAANQLPIMWVGYSTWDLGYAKQNCVNPKSNCNGSCQLKKDYTDVSKSTEPSTDLPTSVVIGIRDLGTMMPSQITHILPDVQINTTMFINRESYYPPVDILPPFTPPK